jgi:WD40 repeat protein
MAERMVFLADGTTLLHTTRSGVVSMWDITTGEQKSQCTGYLLGVSRDSTTFLTVDREGVYAWDSLTGSPMDLSMIEPDQYDLYQRTRFGGFGPGRLNLRLIDVFNIEPPRSLNIHYRAPTKDADFECFQILPTNQQLIAVISGEEAGRSWAQGVCVELISGQVRYTFSVDRFLSSPPFNISIQHRVFSMPSRFRSFTLYDYVTGSARRTVSVDGFGGDVVSVNPQNVWLVATNVYQPRQNAFIHYLNIEHLTPDESGRHWGKTERIIEETGQIQALQFHPGGVYLASLLANDQIHLWNVSTGELLATFH